jgi:hypothetical protein
LLLELSRVAFGTVDRYLVVNGESRRPAALALAGDASALDAREHPGRLLAT